MANPVKNEVAARVRRVDLSTMAPERVDELSAQIGQKIGNELSQATEKIRKMLSIYGLDMKLTYILFPIGQDPTAPQAVETPEVPTQAPKKRSGRKAASKRAPKQ